MIAGMSGGVSNYLRPPSSFTSNPTFAPADASPVTAASSTSNAGIKVSDLKPLQGLAKPISAADDPILRDLLATNWLIMHSTIAPTAADNASQNTYAQVKVDGKVVATVYNGGSSAMTNQAAAVVGDLQDPPGLGGPDLAQWRADNYARLLGGTVEKASTAIKQSQWTPRESPSTTYSREQLDAAFEAMLASGRNDTAQAQSSYLASRTPAAASADFSA
jgi:hypothetical protein